MFFRFASDCGCEQRMKSGKYAAVTLFLAVPQIAAKSCNSRKRLKMLDVTRNYPSFAAPNSKTYAVNYAVLVCTRSTAMHSAQGGRLGLPGFPTMHERR